MFDTASLTDFWLRVLGLYFLVAGIGVFLQLDRLVGLLAGLRTSFLLRFLTGILAFAMGVTILALRGGAGGAEAMAVTLIGWLALFKGVFLILAPPGLLAVHDQLVGNRLLMRIWAVAIALAGVGLLWLGFDS